MSKKILALFLLLTVLVSPAGAAAQTDTTEVTTTATPTVRNNASSVANAARERAMAAKESFKERLAEIKDEKKKQIVENIDSKIQSINERRTVQLSEYLTRLTGVLDRVSTRGAALEAQGKDTSDLEDSIEEARAAIEAAQETVDAQKEKVYTANITTEALLRNAVNSLINQFRTDLKAAFDLVSEAREMVLEAFTEANRLMAEKPEDEASSSATTEE